MQHWDSATEDRYEAVHAVLRHNGFILVSSAGSHRIYRHPDLTEAYKNSKDTDPLLRESFGPDGQLTIPVKNGQTVKGRYLRNILLALDVIKGKSSSQGGVVDG